jgi:VanZ family protein
MRVTPAATWTVVVLSLGSMYFAADHTWLWVRSTLTAVSHLTGGDVREMHSVVRKSAHFMEYALLAVLWFRALAWGPPSRVAARWLALCVCLTCAVVDETHQTFVPNRTASVRDIAIDGMGAAVALAVVKRREASSASLGLALPRTK